MTVYIITPEEHAQIVEALELPSLKTVSMLIKRDDALAMLKEMKPATPCAKLKPCLGGWFVDLDNAPPFIDETLPLYAKEQQ